MMKLVVGKYSQQEVDVPERIEVGETNGGPFHVETAGYIPRSQQIKRFLAAGVTLAEYRRENFHYGPDEKDDGFVDPAGSYVVTDLTDIDEMKAMQQEIQEKIDAANEAMRDKQSASATISDAESGENQAGSTEPATENG